MGQQPFVFTGTIADNIAYSSNAASLDEVRRAAELANIHDEIMMMPNGYETVIAEKGAESFGRTAACLSIARVLLKQPPILILDEATSALDNISKRMVQRALGVRDANRQTILVAHRLSTLRDADRIVKWKFHVFDGGEGVEELKRLEDEADFFAAQASERGVWEVGGGLAFDQDLARCWKIHGTAEVEESGFAAAATAH